MKRLIWALSITIIASSTIIGQGVPQRLQHNILSEHSESRAIPGSHLLQKAEQRIREYLMIHPESIPVRQLSKGNAWSFRVGDSESWWATNLTTEEEYQVNSTCRAVGQNCYLFVEDALWEVGGNGRVTQAAVASMVRSFDSQTPADPNKGIYQTVVDAFGDPPDVDNDPRIIILILDIIDGYEGSGGYVGGYFYSANEFPDGHYALQGTRSNYAEIYYVDGDPQNLNSEWGLSDAMNTTAHEFQHMIHWGKDWREMTFINEGCSEISAVLCGYSLRYQSGYADETNIYLLEWRKDDHVNVFNDYARAARWILYLHEQFPNGYLKKLVAEPEAGYIGINDALETYSPSTPRRFLDILEDWFTANYINDATVQQEYGYSYVPMLNVNPSQTHIDPNVPPTSVTVQTLGAHYIKFTGGSNLSITFNASSRLLKIKAIKMGSTIVEDVPLNSSYDVPELGTVFNEVTFVIMNRNPSLYTPPAVITYSATGNAEQTIMELSYDDGQAVGVLDLDQGDRIAVYFDGIPGTTLDSIRVAFRQTGRIETGINRYTGAFRPTPLGAVMVPSFDMISNSTGSPTPFPVPYDNWVTIDLSTENIDAGSDFVVWFLLGLTPNRPGVMVTREPDAGSYHSFTYRDVSDNWFIPVDYDGNIFNYMVHAYLASPQTGMHEVVIGSPEQYNLSQNFPNPFNPETTIQYTLPLREHVILSIYDTQGRQVARLIDGFKDAGRHQITFDGSRLSSGIYIYRIRAGDYTETRKLTLVK